MGKSSTPATITIELIPDRALGGFTARVPDIPVYGEGDTEDQAIADLKVALRGYIETFGLEDALARINAPSAIRELDWDLNVLAGDLTAAYSSAPRPAPPPTPR
jgi:predicted RNase H-like HicB family nuclease